MKRQAISTSKLAEICGVSQGTVDRALNNREGINPQTKEKILRVAKEYGYRPNIHARSMSGGKSTLIGIVVFDLDNAFFTELVSAAERLCAEQGYHAIISLTHKDPKREIECIENLYYMAVDGIILCPINQGEEFEKFLSSLELPIITVANKLTSFPYAGVDNKTAMYDAVKYVLDNGYEKLVYVMPAVSPLENSYAQDRRLEGFIEATEGLAIETEIQRMPSISLPSGDKSALICACDIYAMRLFNEAKSRGVGIIGFDNIRTIEETFVSLDSISQDMEATAKNAVDFLLHSKEPVGYIKHTIIRRGSV